MTSQHPAVRTTVHRPAIAAGLVLACTLFGDSLLYGVLPLYARQLGIPLVYVGVALSINRWIRLLSNHLAVKVYARMGLIKPLAAACTLTVLTIAAYAYPVHLLLLLGARAVWGVCWSHLRLGSELVVIHTAPERLGLAMGVLHAVSRMGSAFALLVGGALVDNLGYSNGLAAMAALSALSLPLVWVLFLSLKEAHPELPVSLSSGRASGPDGPDMPADRVRTVTEAAPQVPNVRLCYATACVNSLVTRGLVAASISLVLQQRIGSDVFTVRGITIGIATLAGMLLASRFVSTFFVSPWVGHLSDSRGRRPFLLVSLGAEIVALAVIARTGSPAWTMICAFLMFTAGNIVETVVRAAVAHRGHGGSVVRRMGVHATFDDLGSAAGPFLGYLLADFVGFSMTYLVGAAMVAMLFVLYTRPGAVSGPAGRATSSNGRPDGPRAFRL